MTMDDNKVHSLHFHITTNVRIKFLLAVSHDKYIPSIPAK